MKTKTMTATAIVIIVVLTMTAGMTEDTTAVVFANSDWLLQASYDEEFLSDDVMFGLAFAHDLLLKDTRTPYPWMKQRLTARAEVFKRDDYYFMVTNDAVYSYHVGSPYIMQAVNDEQIAYFKFYACLMAVDINELIKEIY